MFKIFIDGQNGTTALQIKDRLAERGDIELIELLDAERKTDAAKRAALDAADVAILCLPDDAARQTAALAKKTRLIDASTAHRTHPDWTYGLPELCPEQRRKIQTAQRVSNPGCYPTGFILLVRPLIALGLLKPEQAIFVSALSGYSGGGKAMIKDYQDQSQTACRPYGLTLKHKHLAEMTQFASLQNDPVFLPHVGDFYQGMLVEIGLTSNHFAKPIKRAVHNLVVPSRFDKSISGGCHRSAPLSHCRHSKAKLHVLGRTQKCCKTHALFHPDYDRRLRDYT